VPALLYVRAVGRRRAATGVLLQATTLTFVIVATEIGLETGKLTQATAAALVAAGLLSAALFPAAGARLLARREPGGPAHVPRPRPAARDQEAEPAGPPPAPDPS
jgi:Kef-type K+ transport system membrane component KefB